jgi:3-dehydroquinate synthase
MREICVNLSGRSYKVAIGAGLLKETGKRLKESGFSGRAVIITDATVNELYGRNLAQQLAGEGFSASTLAVLAGEEQKSLQTASRLYEQLTDVRAERGTPILGLGGGVIGDLAGFVAATYLRGLPLVQLPTTLLAQVDSSVGGKVAVDHGQLKNMVGAFYQPRLVIADTETLETLPEEEFRNGLAEVIKSAAIRDEEFFSFLEEHIERARARDIDTLGEIVYRSVKIKAEVVVQDELDLGLRNILNYGHTIGHAVESVSDFRIKHGQAVAIGMVAAARIAHRMCILDRKEVDRLKKLIERAGLPAKIPDLNIRDIMQAMQHDKKIRENRVRFALLKSIGDAVITDEVSLPLVEQVLEGHENS